MKVLAAQPFISQYLKNILLKFRFPERATKIWKNLPRVLTFLTEKNNSNETILLWVWAERAVLGSAALKFKYEI